MRVAIGKSHHLVLDARAVSRPDTLDLPAEDRRTIQVRPDQIMDRRRRAGLTTLDLLQVRESVQRDLAHAPSAARVWAVQRMGRQFAEWLGYLVAGLDLEALPVDTGAPDSRRCPGLESSQFEAQRPQ